MTRAARKQKPGTALVTVTPTAVTVQPMALAYQRALAAVAACVTIDDAARLQASAAAVAHFAFRAADKTLLIDAQEIRLRASIKLGLLCLEIGRASVAGPGRHTLPAAGKSKHQVLVDAAVNPATAYVAEELCGGRDPVNQKAAQAAAEALFSEARRTGQPASMARLRRVVRTAIGLPEEPHRERTMPAAPAAPVDLPASAQAAGADLAAVRAAVLTVARLDPGKLLPQLVAITDLHTLTVLQAEAEKAELVVGRLIAALVALRTRLAPRDELLEEIEGEPPAPSSRNRAHEMIAVG
jgi:hypothetical protein